MPTLAPTTSWQVLDPFVFRTTGFAFDALMPLGLRESAAALDRLQADEGDIADAGVRWWQQAFAPALQAAERQQPKPRRSVRALCAIRAALKRLQPVPEAWIDEALDGASVAAARDAAQAWNARLVLLGHAKAAAQGLFDAEHADAIDALWREAADPAFQEAVFLSSPDAHEGLARSLAGARRDTSKQRLLDRLAFSYLQRLCAKNDTTSFFGPVQYGSLADADADADAGAGAGAPSLAFRADGRRRWRARKAYLAQWAVAALAQRLAEDPEVYAALRPQRSALVSDTDDGRGFVHHGTGTAFELPAPLAELLRASDGSATVADLAQARGPEAPARLRQLARLKLVDCALPVVSTAVDALAALQAAVQALPVAAAARAQPLLQQAQAHRAAFERQAWPERRGAFLATEAWLQALGMPARRNGGALYGDRLALHEDCAGPLQSLRVGGPLRQRLHAALPPVMEFLAAAAVLRRLDAQDEVIARMGGSGPHRYIDLVRQLPTRVEPGPREQALHAALRRLMDDACGGDGIRLSLQTAWQALAPWREEIEQGLAACPLLLPSPDVMVASPSRQALDRGDFTLVLSELHDDCSTVFGGFFAEFHPRPAALRALLEDRIRRRPGWTGLATVLGQRRSKHVTPELPGTTVRLAGVSAKPAADVVPISEVMVEAGPHGLTLQARGRRLWLYPGDVHSLAHAAFALPGVVPLDWLAIWGRAAVPRVTLGEVVVQRACWQLDTSAMPRLPAGPVGLEGLRCMRRWLSGHGVPEWSFARWSAKDKPLLVDATNPWALDLLQRHARQHPTARLTEMYPDPAHLCFDAGRGRQTFELRLAMVREESAPAGAGQVQAQAQGQAQGQAVAEVVA